MSKYTIELREILAGPLEALFWNSIPNLKYMSESYRDNFKQAFFEKYAFREIGFTTTGRFAFEVNTKIGRVYDMYNDLFTKLTPEKITSIDPFIDNKRTSKVNVESNTTATATADNRDITTPAEPDYDINVSGADNVSIGKNDSNATANEVTIAEEKTTSKNEMELLREYKNKWVDLMDDLTDEFNNLFMRCY